MKKIILITALLASVLSFKEDYKEDSNNISQKIISLTLNSKYFDSIYTSKKKVYFWDNYGYLKNIQINNIFKNKNKIIIVKDSSLRFINQYITIADLSIVNSSARIQIENPRLNKILSMMYEFKDSKWKLVNVNLSSLSYDYIPD